MKECERWLPRSDNEDVIRRDVQRARDLGLGFHLEVIFSGTCRGSAAKATMILRVHTLWDEEWVCEQCHTTATMLTNGRCANCRAE